MKQIEIKARYTDEIIISRKYESMREYAEKNKAYLSGADLSGAYLFGADLSRADLSGADLSRAYLSRAYLSRADLFGADLSGADLFGADLFGADLSGADLSGADLFGADLSRADLSGADLSRAYLFGADLFGAKNYSELHEFFQELVKRQSIDYFIEKEWSIIGKILIKKLCWNTIKKEFGKDFLTILKKISQKGFDEYEKKYKEILKT